MKISDELKRGKANLQAWGWGRGLISLQTGSVCAIGALMLPSERAAIMVGMMPISTAIMRSKHRDAAEYLRQALPAYRSLMASEVWQYNDYIATSRQDILDLYDRAIALAEADEQLKEIQTWVNSQPAQEEVCATIPS